ncbi:unnamed protein product [Prorocentrum cordatum]|uniref:Uncharacterized protein n=1 Tax=Prorocentrum cordatum TaxID=2364126 RepID=A0ABN9WJ33_9DINO|nr:unnamed protein product [Polarella glacialis]
MPGVLAREDLQSEDSKSDPGKGCGLPVATFEELVHAVLPPQDADLASVHLVALVLLGPVPDPVVVSVLQNPVRHPVAVVVAQACNVTGPCENVFEVGFVPVPECKVFLHSLYALPDSLHECFRSGIIFLSSPRSVEVCLTVRFQLPLHQKSDVDTRERKSFKRAQIGGPVAPTEPALMAARAHGGFERRRFGWTPAQRAAEGLAEAGCGAPRVTLELVHPAKQSGRHFGKATQVTAIVPQSADRGPRPNPVLQHSVPVGADAAPPEARAPRPAATPSGGCCGSAARWRLQAPVQPSGGATASSPSKARPGAAAPRGGAAGGACGEERAKPRDQAVPKRTCRKRYTSDRTARWASRSRRSRC